MTFDEAVKQIKRSGPGDPLYAGILDTLIGSEEFLRLIKASSEYHATFAEKALVVSQVAVAAMRKTLNEKPNEPIKRESRLPSAGGFAAALNQVMELHQDGKCPPECDTIKDSMKSHEGYMLETAVCCKEIFTSLDPGMLISHLVSTYHAGLIAGRAEVMAELTEVANVEEKE